ncbi:MAG: helix-turn-helix domain-containing protein [Acidimicrobiales bacterium]
MSVSEEVGQMELSELPVVLSVEEAAGILRIGRTCAYDLARRYEATEGREGLPVIRVGRLFRVPRASLLRLLGLPEASA